MLFLFQNSTIAEECCKCRLKWRGLMSADRQPLTPKQCPDLKMQGTLYYTNYPLRFQTVFMKTSNNCCPRGKESISHSLALMLLLIRHGFSVNYLLKSINFYITSSCSPVGLILTFIPYYTTLGGGFSGI